MKTQIAGLTVFLTVVALNPTLASAKTIECSNGQDAYSATLHQMGLERMARARAVLDNMLNPPAQKPAITNTLFEKAGHAVAQADRRIPVSILNHAKCVVILPHEINIGAGILPFGYQYGTGVSFCRGQYGIFGEGKFVKLEGGSFGPQIGLEHTEQVLLFTNKSAIEHLDHASIKLGADVSVAAGTVGRDAQVDTNINLGDRVFSYSHSKGLYAGASLRGGVLSPDKKMTEAVEGKRIHRNIFESVRHFFARVFGQKADTCSTLIGTANSSSDLGSVVNPAPLANLQASVCQLNAKPELAAPATAALHEHPEATAHFSGPAQ